MDLIAVAPLLRDVITSEAHAEQARQTMRRILNAMQTLRSNAAEARSHLAREVENAARGCGTCQAVAASEHIRLAESIDVAEHTKYVALESEVVAIEEYIDAFERAFLAVADAVDTPAGFSSIRLTNSIPTVRAAALATPPARGPLESTAIKFITSKSVGRLGEILIPAAPSAADVLVQWRKVPRRVIPGHPLRLCLALSGAFRSQQFRRADVHAALNSLCNSVHVSLAIAESCEAGAAVHPVRHDIFPETVTVDLSEEQVNVSIAIPIDLCTTYFSGWELVLLAVSVGQDAVPQPFAFGNGAPLRLLIGAAHAKQQLGDVFEASKSGDVAALVKALIDGGSTEEASYVSDL